jgi:hypothetical protein
VFQDAKRWIGAPGFRIHGSASNASAVYCGVFCLLAINNARDWRRGEDILLQELQDHHVVPQAYLRRHAITKRVDVNTIANRTLISDETNGRIKDKAPADYLVDPTIFPSEARLDLLRPHFVDETTLRLLRDASERIPDEAAIDLYSLVVRAREAAMIEEIRRACGIMAVHLLNEADVEPDEVAADVGVDAVPSEEGVESLQLEPA